MKTRTVLIVALLLTLGQTIPAGPCEDLITTGRVFLAEMNLPAANNCFSNAVVACPGHQTGNVFYAATRLLTWPMRPAGSNFLNRLGVTHCGPRCL